MNAHASGSSGRSTYTRNEICLFLFSADSRQDVARAAELAALDPIRIVEAISSGEEDQ